MLEQTLYKKLKQGESAAGVAGCPHENKYTALLGKLGLTAASLLTKIEDDLK